MKEHGQNILIIAGETSGDHYGAGLVQALLSRKGVSAWGMGGSAMKNAGMELIQDIKGLDVMGFWDVLIRIFTFKKIFNTLVSEMENRKPDAVVLIDYPGFNIRFAEAAKNCGIPVVYFISPKVWAWKSGRIQKLASWCSKMLVFFEFELDVYKGSGLKTVLVGHPLVKELEPFRADKGRFREELKLSPDKPLIGLIPGSREREVRKMFPAMLDAASFLHSRIEGIQFAAACAPSIETGFLASFIQTDHPTITLVQKKTHELMAAADALMITSGTATLEAGIIGIPHVICYRVGLITYLIAKPLVKTKDVGLVNIAAGKRILPELIQYNMTPSNIADNIEEFLTDRKKYEQVCKDMEEMASALRQDNTYEKAADEIIRVINR
jgi:lipid-A-disaccharide synthase